MGQATEFGKAQGSGWNIEGLSEEQEGLVRVKMDFGMAELDQLEVVRVVQVVVVVRHCPRCRSLEELGQLVRVAVMADVLGQNSAVCWEASGCEEEK